MAIRFLLNGERHVVEGVRPDRMLLGWLREDAGLIGTKEGCGEGDCGACTVALGEIGDDGTSLRWRAVNACILFLGAVDGKAVLTVEGLADADGTLHPVQQALVDHHASQCGFCTPGFAMTLFSHWWRRGPVDRASLDDLLAGNLCRCTGYRPILDAARALHDVAGGAGHRTSEAATLDQLRAWSEAQPLDADGFARPRSLDELATHLVAHPDALLVAGGTDAGLWVTKELTRYDHVVSTVFVDELRRIERKDGYLDVGAAATYTDLLPHADALWPEVGRMLRRLGSELIRNSGTLGGNLGSASPIGDALPVLLALDAKLVLRKGERTRELGIEVFFLDYKRTALEAGEFVERVRLPLPEPHLRVVVEKISKRVDQDISTVLGVVGAAVRAGRLERVRVAFGGMAAIPKRAALAEAALEGRPPNEAAFAEAAVALAQEFAPLSDMRATAAYRLVAAQAVLRKAGLAFAGTPSALPTAPLEPAG